MAHYPHSPKESAKSNLPFSCSQPILPPPLLFLSPLTLLVSPLPPPLQVPRGASPALCFKAALVHIDDNRLADAAACLDVAFAGLEADRAAGKNVGAQAKVCAHYKVAVALLRVSERASARASERVSECVCE